MRLCGPPIPSPAPPVLGSAVHSALRDTVQQDHVIREPLKRGLNTLHASSPIGFSHRFILPIRWIVHSLIQPGNQKSRVLSVGAPNEGGGRGGASSALMKAFHCVGSRPNVRRTAKASSARDNALASRVGRKSSFSLRVVRAGIVQDRSAHTPRGMALAYSTKTLLQDQRSIRF
jgi:hypothetical protein